MFRMTVQDVFFIRNRGLVATGRVEHGELRVGDEVRINEGSAVRVDGLAGAGDTPAASAISDTASSSASESTATDIVSSLHHRQLPGGSSIVCHVCGMSWPDPKPGTVALGSPFQL